MKIFISMILSLSIISFPEENTLSKEQHQYEEAPSYAKWGRIAMKETKAQYPEADIIDYLHRGKEVKGEYSIEKFKLWLRKDNKEFGVFIDLKFKTQTEKLMDITFTETSR